MASFCPQEENVDWSGCVIEATLLLFLRLRDICKLISLPLKILVEEAIVSGSFHYMPVFFQCPVSLFLRQLLRVSENL